MSPARVFVLGDFLLVSAARASTSNSRAAPSASPPPSAWLGGLSVIVLGDESGYAVTEIAEIQTGRDRSHVGKPSRAPPGFNAARLDQRGKAEQRLGDQDPLRARSDRHALRPTRRCPASAKSARKTASASSPASRRSARSRRCATTRRTTPREPTSRRTKRIWATACWCKRYTENVRLATPEMIEQRRAWTRCPGSRRCSGVSA